MGRGTEIFQAGEAPPPKSGKKTTGEQKILQYYKSGAFRRLPSQPTLGDFVTRVEKQTI
jgi:hypothetical protein